MCPFRNVTQREKVESWNSFHGILGWVQWLCAACMHAPQTSFLRTRHGGVWRRLLRLRCMGGNGWWFSFLDGSIWGHWVVEEGEYRAQQFTDGTACSEDLSRSIRVRGGAVVVQRV